MISIVIPIHNISKYSERSFQSLCEQTNKDFELIVVNDGCEKVKIEEFVESVRPKDVQTFVIHHDQNRSALQAKITGIFAAKRKYVLLFDCDDKIDANLIKRATSHLSKYNPDILSFFFDSKIVVAPRRKFNFEVLYNDAIIENYVNNIRRDEYLICHKLFKREMAIKAIEQSILTPDDYINFDDVLVLGILFHTVAKTYIKDDNVGTYIYMPSEGNVMQGVKNDIKGHMPQYERAYEIARDFLAKRHWGSNIMSSFAKWER